MERTQHQSKARVSGSVLADPAIRLQRAEVVRAAKEPDEVRLDWTGFPRPERDRAQLANQQPLRVSGSVLADPEVSSGTLHASVPA